MSYGVRVQEVMGTLWGLCVRIPPKLLSDSIRLGLSCQSQGPHPFFIITKPIQTDDEDEHYEHHCLQKKEIGRIRGTSL